MSNTISLQGIGNHAAKPASEICVGDVLVWNFGSTSEVAAVRDVSEKFIEIDEVCRGKTYTRRLMKTRMVADKAMRKIAA